VSERSSRVTGKHGENEPGPSGRGSGHVTRRSPSGPAERQEREATSDPREPGAGVGLGLAVARGFTNAMGGELMIDDTPSGGTTMVIELEVADTS